MKTMKLLGILALAAAPAWGAGDFWESVELRGWQRVDGTAVTNAKPYQVGFRADGDEVVVENPTPERNAGAGWMMILNQKTPQPVRFSADAKAVKALSGNGMLLYVDVSYADGSSLCGQTVRFDPDPAAGWHRRTVEILPAKPIRLCAVYTMLQRTAGTARFRNMRFETQPALAGFARFDSVLVKTRPAPAQAGFYVRDAAAGSGFEPVVDGAAKGMKVAVSEKQANGATFFDVSVTPADPAQDRAITLVYAVPFDVASAVWHDDPRTNAKLADAKGEHSYVSSIPCGTGSLTMWPLGAVSDAHRTVALGVDPLWPSIYRIAANSALGVVYLAMDLGFAPEHPAARVKFAAFPFAREHAFRGALAAYGKLYPLAFESRIPDYGIWQVSTAISQIDGYEDFGFKYMEGGGTHAWDDRHDVYTFKYTEPCSWWMTCLGKDGGLPTMAECLAKAEGWLNQTTNRNMQLRAKAWKASAAIDARGNPIGEIQFAPWTKGIMWCMNSAPGINGGDNDYWHKNPESEFAARYSQPFPKGTDGEYIDSAEMCFNFGCDFNRAHFAGMTTPLTFEKESKRVCVAGALASYEYCRKTAERLRARGKYVQANSTPHRTSMLVPWLDVPGTEIKWYRAGKWFPTNDRGMLYKRAVCGLKPYCFLQNTEFDEFHPYVERYMQRALAYGMLSGFFSSNGSTDCYFSKKSRYEIDRPLFKKYVPLQKELARAGWRPVATLAASSNPEVYVEQFGDRYVTVYNGSLTAAKKTVITSAKASARERVTGEIWDFADGKYALELPPETVRMLDFGAPGREVVLTPDSGEVVVAEKAAPTVRFAATELTNALARAFGRALPVVARPTPGRVSLVLGDTVWSRAAGIDVKRLAQDGFVVRAVSNLVFLAGKDDPHLDLPARVKEGYFWRILSQEHATVFAVYDFLERAVGARFYFPGECGTIVPRRASVAVGKLNVVSEPASQIRDYYPGGGGVAPGEDPGGDRYRSEWKARILLYQRMSTVHIPLCHGQNKFDVPKRFAKTHPEYFALLKDTRTGEIRRDTDPARKMAFHSDQLCQSSRLWEDVFYPEAKARLLAGKKYVDVMPHDGMPPCLCALCQAAYSKTPGDRQYATELMWGKTAALAQRLIDEKVPGFVTQMAYPPYRRIPAFALPTNILVQVAEKGPWGTQFPDVWTRDNAEIRGWSEKLGHKVWTWNYPGKWGQYATPGVPQMSPKAWGRYFKSVFPWSFGAFAESESDRAIYNYLNHYVFAKVMWDPTVDVDALLKEHYRLMFGAAADRIERFYDDLERKWIEDVTGHGRAQATSLGPGMYAFPSEFAIRAVIYGPKEVARWERLFDEAVACVGAASDEGRRVAYVREQFLAPLKAANAAFLARLDAAAEARRRAARPRVNLLGADDLCAARKLWWPSRGVAFEKGAGYGGADAIHLHCASNKVSTGRKFGDEFLEKGARYRFSYYVKQSALGGTTGGAYAEYADFGSASMRERWHFVPGSPIRDAHDWIAQSFEFTAGTEKVPEKKSYLQVFLNAPGEAWISDIRLEKMDKTE